MKNPNFKITGILLGLLLFTACASSKKLVDSYVGKWGYEIETPQGNYNGNMEIVHAGKTFTGKLNSDMGSVDLDDLVIKDGKLKATFDMQGNSISISGDFQGEVFNGNVEAGGYQIPFKATRIKE